MSRLRIGILVGILSFGLSVRGEAQDASWVADGTVGYAGFVDDATQDFFVIGGSVRKYVTPRISIGPEFVWMKGGDALRERTTMLTANVVFDAYPPRGRDARPVTPFLVGGLGGFWTRDQFVTGPFSSSDPAFTVGGGVRGRVGRRVSMAAEYRIGWELHQRLTGSMTLELR